MIANGKACRVLLAEDNSVNQRLAVAILERCGHHVVVAGNGREVLELLANETFDLILMDVQMPEMGGFEATAAIRSRERVTGEHMPIIALTARAMAGERERCVDAGMDDYITQPLRADALFAAMDRLFRRVPCASRTAAPRDGPESVSPVERVFDGVQLLKRAGGDEVLMFEIVQLFREGLPRHVAEIRSAMASGDSIALQFAAHNLKGSLGTLTATEAQELAAELERLGQQGRVDEAPAICEEFQAALQRLEGMLSLVPRPSTEV